MENKMTKPHRIFSVTEILEAILLETDMRTLLTSAQRVCQKWHLLIKESNNLQAHLFFRPVDNSKTQSQDRPKRQRNPLLEDHLYPHFYQKQLHSMRRHPYFAKVQLPFLDPAKEGAFLREEASWRNMLLQQPPTSHIGLIDTSTRTDSPEFTEVVFTPNSDSHLRMRHLDSGLVLRFLMPGHDKWLFWGGPEASTLRLSERHMRDEREVAVSNYLKHCDFVLIRQDCRAFYEAPRFHYCDWGFGDWVRSLGKYEVFEKRLKLPMWTY